MKRELLSAIALVALASPAMAGQSCDVIPQISPADQSVKELDPSGNPTVVKLNGQSSKDTTKYLWVQTSGPAVTLQEATSAQPTFVVPEVGPSGATLTFRLDASGCSPLQTKSLTTTVKVATTNQAPVAAATVSPEVVYEGTPLVTLDGSASSDPDGNPLSYVWSQLSGPAVTLHADGAKATFAAPADVPYPDGVSLSFRLTVSDGTLSSSTDKIVNVQWVNEPPKAVLACPETVNEGGSLVLDGSGSSDSDDGLAAYAWIQLQGTPNADLPDYDPATAARLEFTAPRLDSPNNKMDFRLQVTDYGKLTQDAVCTVKVLDVTAPVIGDGPGNLTAEATSAAGAEVTFTAPTATDNVDGVLAVSCTPASGATFPLGTSTVTCSVSDAAQNGASKEFSIKVQDTTAPAVTPPAPVTAEATGPTTEVAIGTASATDAVGVKAITSNAPASYPVGATIVTWSASDDAGNVGNATQSVTVRDTTAPVVTPPAAVTVEATGPSTSVVIGNASASDAVGVISLTSDAPSVFPVGTTVVTWAAKDAAGNTGTAPQSVTVQDTTPPALKGVPSGLTLITGQAATYEPTATDLVDGDVPVLCTPGSGYSFALGTSTVTCSAKDSHGNRASANFNVTVQYGFNGLLAPYDANKSYKVKSAIPLKWQFTNNTGAVLASAGAQPAVTIYQVSSGVAAEDAITLDDAGASGLQYDNLTNTWQFNWKTTGLSAGIYNVYIQSTLTGQKIGPFPVKLAK
ncbi:HYR domain-containing protein [Geomonas subterranea]|uniref:HYR domain-containing protein n=1 Tax=Geomonas subterranea TaxID=2847989 RepID=A0ABX8LM29_9BACT|nr:HYR domain-containing protein [Geomonas subterranea]QXE92396.1 HYR domain-containing protein [Geomonas subterranea]QXM09505.1 HYR domain-containing protein [Geomonas subterranea]